MVPKLQCTVEAMGELAEEAWMVYVCYDDVPALILLLNGLLFHKISQITFADHYSGKSVSLHREPEGDYVLQIKERTFSVTTVWLKALLSIVLDVQFCGWGEGAHLDSEFTDLYGALDFTVCITYM